MSLSHDQSRELSLSLSISLSFSLSALTGGGPVTITGTHTTNSQFSFSLHYDETKNVHEKKVYGTDIFKIKSMIHLLIKCFLLNRKLIFYILYNFIVVLLDVWLFFYRKDPKARPN